METAKEREVLQQPRQAWWPLDTMACGLDHVGNSCLLLGWDPRLRCFGLELGVVGGAAGAAGEPGGTDHAFGHELELFFPKCMEFPGSEESAAVADLPAVEDLVAVMPEDKLDALLQSFWDSDKEQLVGVDSSCVLKDRSTATTLSSFQGDDHLLALSSASPTGPTLPERENTVEQPPAEQPPSSSSSHCNEGPRASDTGGAKPQATRDSCSSKRSTTPEADAGEWSGRSSSKRSRKQAAPPCAAAGSSSPSVVYPFAVVKPSGVVDGGATLADINARILTPPARPVRHPVGEFACVPRVSCGGRRLAPSGKVAAGFVRLHTAGKGTITITRTEG